MSFHRSINSGRLHVIQKYTAVVTIAAFTVFSSFLSGCSNQHGPDTLAIYLPNKPIPLDSMFYKELKVEDFQAQGPPLFSAQDFISYDIKSHRFKVTAEAARRFSTRLVSPPALRNGKEEFDLAGVPDQAFIMVAMGQPVYVGVIAGHSTSFKYAVPVLMSEKYGFSGANDVTFVIKRELLPEPYNGEDIRSDQRIQSAAKSLGL